MCGFNTLVFMQNPKPVGPGPATWDDQLQVACASFVNDIQGCLYASNGPAGRSSFGEDRTIKVWKAQGCDSSYGCTGGTIIASLSDVTASVTIYTANFGTVGSGGTANLSGNPLATYTLPKGNVLQSTISTSSTSMICGAGFLFSAVPTGTLAFDFNGKGDLIVDVGYFNSVAGFFGANAHGSVLGTYSSQQVLNILKVQFANCSYLRTGCVPQILQRIDVFGLYNATSPYDPVYNAANTNTPANSTAMLAGNPIVSYTLPAGNGFSIGLKSWQFASSSSYDDILAIAIGLHI